MSILFQLEVVIVAILFISFVFRLIRKDQLSAFESFLWAIVSIILIVFSLVPNVPTKIAHTLGFEVTANFIYFITNLFIAVYLFVIRIESYKQKDTIRLLVQEVSILKEKVSKSDNREE